MPADVGAEGGGDDGERITEGGVPDVSVEDYGEGLR